MKYDNDIPTQAGDLQAFFDGELEGPDAERMARSVEADAELRAHLGQMTLMRDLVGRSMEMRAAEVPRARFEQIWDEIDRTISEDARSVEAPASFWQRVWSAIRPFRVPAFAAVAAAAVAVVVLRSGDAPPVNQEPEVASVPRSAEPAPPDAKVAPGPASIPAPAIAESFPSPRAADAEIHGIEFGGKQGRISHTGVVTVLYVEEDAATQKSERSL
ncbi:MAG: hypothetical protein JNK45_26215 [Myxococcales bacterium]|nr:hypothetical protein [Myxococcales bacterium]